jgi:hypothetical protein
MTLPAYTLQDYQRNIYSRSQGVALKNLWHLADKHVADSVFLIGVFKAKFKCSKLVTYPYVLISFIHEVLYTFHYWFCTLYLLLRHEK